MTDLATQAQHLPYQTPQPGIPTAWIMLITSWAMKVKKKAIKLKELSVLQEKARSLPAPPAPLRCKGREMLPGLGAFRGRKENHNKKDGEKPG